MVTLDHLPLFDLQDASFQSDPHGTFGPLLSQGPLARTRRGIEVLSYDWSSRKPLEDFEFEGFGFQRGQWVFLSNHAATRDPAAFPDPHRYDIDREQTFSLAFGRGLHHCAGQMLARAGMEEALLVLSRRLPDLQQAGTVVESRPTSMVGGPEVMPVRFRKS